MLDKILEHPLTRGLSVDDQRTTLLRREIIQSKTLLKNIYQEWYETLVNSLTRKNDILELGSGAGFLRQHLPDSITSEVFFLPGIQLVANACQLPMRSKSLDAIVMVDVFHHIPNVRQFFQEATRCIRESGQIVMIEPWRTPWSEIVYKHFHPEPFLPDAEWEIPSSGPLSGANGALPWIVFDRDIVKFETEFPGWHLKSINPIMPLVYLLSGGVSMRSLFPGWLYRTIRRFESFANQQNWAMFAVIELKLKMTETCDT